MTVLSASFSKKAQLKIQQMSFVLIAVMILFALTALIYLSIWLPNIQKKADVLKQQEAREIVRKFAGTPEFSFTSDSDCSACVDLDKLLMIKTASSYRNFWNLDYLMVERIVPQGTNVECTRANYPDCNRITIIKKTEDFGKTSDAFVTLVRYVPNEGGYFSYEIGRIHASGLSNE